MARASQWILLVAIITGLAGSLALSTGASGQSATPVTAAPAEPIELRVMTFNVWLGGVEVDLAQVVAAIKAARADVVGLQEAEAHTREIAAALGWLYVDERLRIISRYPLLDPPGADGLYTFIAPLPGQVIAMANVHLPSDPYGPDAVLAGSTPDEVLTLETEIRLPKLEDTLTRLPAADGGELARIPFWVQLPTAVPSVAPEKPVFAIDEPIIIHWSSAPGNKWDWIGIYAAGDSDLYNYLGFLYTEAEPEGAVTFDAEALGEALPPGDYEACLMRDDGYVILATAPFTVAAEAP